MNVINDVLKQWVAFHGFNTNGMSGNLSNANSNTFNYFTNPNQADVGQEITISWDID